MTTDFPAAEAAVRRWETERTVEAAMEAAEHASGLLAAVTVLRVDNGSLRAQRGRLRAETDQRVAS